MATHPKSSSGPMQVIFAVLMLALAALCVWLGVWQWHRLGEKEALIAAVDARLHAAPVAAPAKAQWPTLDTTALEFQLVTVTGTLRPDQSVRIFTSLVDGKGPASGPGYWVVTPLVLPDGGTVLVNRGFVPEAKARDFAGGTPATALVTVTGLLRSPEAVGMFTPAASPADRIDYVRNPQRLGQMIDPAIGPIAPFYIDQAAGAPGVLPQGGETVVEFPNNHFGYALTWFGFAIVAVVMLAYWLWRQRRPAPSA